METKTTTLISTCNAFATWRDGQLHTSIYDKRDDFNFHITGFSFLSINISKSLITEIPSLTR